MAGISRESRDTDPVGDDLSEMELTDGDILDAMQHIPGYLDITTEDFRTIYHLAHHHAVGRLVGDVRACKLMRVRIERLLPDMPLDEAARVLVRSGYKGLPVVDADNRVMGMLTETDFLRRLKVDTFLELLLSMLDDAFEFTHRCHETPVRAAMTPSPITVAEDASFGEIMRAFQQHAGRSVPVVGKGGELVGLLLRKDFLAMYRLKNPQ